MGRPAAPEGARAQDQGYVRIKLPDHPFAASGWVREHIAVLLAEIGLEGAPCHYCGRDLDWGADLHVDHLNRDRQDNRPENLVPSCLGCNNGNQAPGMRRWCGPRWNRDTEPKYWKRCEVCGGKFGTNRKHRATGSDRCRKQKSRHAG